MSIAYLSKALPALLSGLVVISQEHASCSCSAVPQALTCRSNDSKRHFRTPGGGGRR